MSKTKPYYELTTYEDEETPDIYGRTEFPYTADERSVIREFAEAISLASVPRATLIYYQPGEEPAVIASFNRAGIGC